MSVSSQLITASVGLASGTVAAVAGMLADDWISANSDETNEMKCYRKEELRTKVAGYIRYGKELCSEDRLRYLLFASLRTEWRKHSARGEELQIELKSEFGKEASDKFGDYLAAHVSYGECVEAKAAEAADELERILEREIERARHRA